MVRSLSSLSPPDDCSPPDYFHRYYRKVIAAADAGAGRDIADDDEIWDGGKLVTSAFCIDYERHNAATNLQSLNPSGPLRGAIGPTAALPTPTLGGVGAEAAFQAGAAAMAECVSGADVFRAPSESDRAHMKVVKVSAAVRKGDGIGRWGCRGEGGG